MADGNVEELVEKNLYDVAGVRVICAFQEDIYRLADLLLQQDDIRLIRTKDYIKNPKPNGYRSLHLILEGSGFSGERENACKDRSTVPYHCYGLLGQRGS